MRGRVALLAPSTTAAERWRPCGRTSATPIRRRRYSTGCTARGSRPRRRSRSSCATLSGGHSAASSPAVPSACASATPRSPATGVSTWAERVVDAGAAVSLRRRGLGAAHADELPLSRASWPPCDRRRPRAAPPSTARSRPCRADRARGHRFHPAVGARGRADHGARRGHVTAPVRSTPARPTPAPPRPRRPRRPRAELDGDHDGLTVASIDLRRLRAERAARGRRGAPAPAPRSRHRPRRPTCACPTAALEPIGHEVVLGRAPSVSQVSGGRIPRLITIGAGDPDISRNHVRLAVEGDTVVMTDLHSRNGTHVVAPGKPPVKLRAGEPTPVLTGTVVDLGGGWTLQVVGSLMRRAPVQPSRAARIHADPAARLRRIRRRLPLRAASCRGARSR